MPGSQGHVVTLVGRCRHSPHRVELPKSLSLPPFGPSVLEPNLARKGERSMLLVAHIEEAAEVSQTKNWDATRQ